MRPRTWATSDWRRPATPTSPRRFAAIPTWSCTDCCAPTAAARSTRRGAKRFDEELPEIARHTSERERRADDAERELLQWRKVRFMADKVGDEFDGYITGVAAFGLFVELVEHFVEGLVHISSMADDYYRYLETSHTLHGENTHKVYRLGEKVRVQVIRVDLERRQIDLGLTEILDTIREGEDRRGPRRSKAAPKAEPRRAKSKRDDRGKRERAAKKAVSARAAREVSDGCTHVHPRRRHRRPHRSRQEHARAGADRHRPRPPEGREGARHHHRSWLRQLGSGDSTSRLSTSPGTSDSSGTCSPAWAGSTPCCSWSPPTKA